MIRFSDTDKRDSLIRNPPTLFREMSHALTVCRRSHPRADALQTTRSFGPWLEFRCPADFLTQIPAKYATASQFKRTNETWHSRRIHSHKAECCTFTPREHLVDNCPRKPSMKTIWHNTGGGCLGRARAEPSRVVSCGAAMSCVLFQLFYCSHTVVTIAKARAKGWRSS